MTGPSPTGNFLLAAGAGLAGHRLFSIGTDAASVGAAVCGLLAIKYGFQGLHGWDTQAERKHARKQAQKTSTTYGAARFGTKRDAKNAGMMEPGGLFQGRLAGRDLYTPRECCHGLVIAPPGQGKGINHVVPALLTLGTKGTHSENTSLIVTDISGELTAMTAKHRRERFGHRVIVINPYREKLAEELGVDLGDDGFNPLGFIKPGPDVKDDAELVASFLIPGHERMSGSEAFFVRFGRDILACFILYLVSRGVPSRVTLPEVRRMLMLPPDQFQSLLDEMLLIDAFGGVVREYGGKLATTLENAPEEFQGGHSTATAALSIYDSHGPLGDHVSRGAFDFRSVKDRPTTVYIILPSDRSTHAPYLNLVVSLSMELLGRDRRNKPVMFLLDELANLGYLPSILRGMALYRKQGLRVQGYVQSLGQLDRLYGRQGLRDFLAMADIITAFGVQNDFETLQHFSNLTGQATVKDFSENLRPERKMNEFADMSFGSANHGTPLLRPEDIRTMSEHKQLILYKNAPPFLAEKMSYLTRRRWRNLAEPNPYHRGSG